MKLFGIARTLIFPIPSLDFLVLAFLYFTLQYTSALGFVEASDLQYLGRVEP